MLIYLPYKDSADTAKCLDDWMLKRQVLECWSVYAAITHPRATQHTPPINMWLYYSDYLSSHSLQLHIELNRRGYPLPAPVVPGDVFSEEIPHWIDDQLIYSSHRANLLRLNYRHYSQFNWTEQPDNVIHWPLPRYTS